MAGGTGPATTSHNQPSPWSSALALSHWRECNELHFISSLPLQGLPHWGIRLITGRADFIRHFPPLSAMGARQHPQQGPLLSCFGGGECELWVQRPRLRRMSLSSSSRCKGSVGELENSGIRCS